MNLLAVVPHVTTDSIRTAVKAVRDGAAQGVSRSSAIADTALNAQARTAGVSTARIDGGVQTASALQIAGAIGFGALIGWYVYFINRYRRGDVQVNDLVTVAGVLGGGAMLKLFPAGSDLFGGYGIGLFLGFFGYFAFLLLFVGMSKDFRVDWFLDGRRKEPQSPWATPSDQLQRPMDKPDDSRKHH